MSVLVRDRCDVGKLIRAWSLNAASRQSGTWR